MKLIIYKFSKNSDMNMYLVTYFCSGFDLVLTSLLEVRTRKRIASLLV